MPTKLSTIEIDMSTLEDALRRAAEKLDEKDYAILKAVVDAYDTITELVDDKNTTIARLRKLLFGSQTEKTKAVVGDGKDSPPPSPQAVTASASATDIGVSTNAAEAEKSPRPGHGRNGADAYTGAEKIVVAHESLQPGDACPSCGKGTVYETGRPGVLVRLVGQAPIQAKVYELQKLRCNLCGEVFTASAPQGVGAEKYDATLGSMIALLKYGSGMPFNRSEGLQGSLGIPLPASTQWEIVWAKAKRIAPAYEELVCQAAQGEVVYNDDTTVKILELMAHGRKSKLLRKRRRTIPRSRKCQNAADCSPRASYRLGMAAASPCFSAAGNMRARISRTCSSVAWKRWTRRFRCAMRCCATCRANCRRSWPIVWRMAGGGSSRWRTAFPRSAATCWNHWQSFIATTRSPASVSCRRRLVGTFIKRRAAR